MEEEQQIRGSMWGPGLPLQGLCYQQQQRGRERTVVGGGRAPAAAASRREGQRCMLIVVAAAGSRGRRASVAPLHLVVTTMVGVCL